MRLEQEIAVECPGCGQVYHLAPQHPGQRAQCNRCKQVFVVAASVVEHRVSAPAPRSQARVDRAASETIALKSAQFRRPVDWNWSSFCRQQFVVIPAVALLVVGVIGAGVILSATKPKAAPKPSHDLRRGRVAKLSVPRSDFEFRTISELVEAVEPAVVQVQTTFGQGSGFVVDPAGLIVTCHHVIEGARFAKVIFPDKREVEVVGVRALRPKSDLAILQVDTDEPLPALALAGTTPKKGDPLVAFGSPVGLSFTVSEGSVSALRTYGELFELEERLYSNINFTVAPGCKVVQFAASTMPGSSGGPVVDYRAMWSVSRLFTWVFVARGTNLPSRIRKSKRRQCFSMKFQHR
jgi:hypothetical protein